VKSQMTPAEWGLLGYEALVKKYGVQQVNRWRRTGGRPKHRSYAEIVGATATGKAARKNQESPMGDTTTKENAPRGGEALSHTEGV
jgi:hypothetical protein